MFTSIKNKIVFFHVPKTAGTSIHNYLKTFYEETPVSNISVSSFLKNNYKISIPDTDPPPFIHHIKAKNYLKFFPDHKNYFKFAFVRNPYERLLSAYSDFTQHRNINAGDIPSNYRKLLMSKNVWDNNCLTVARTYPTDKKIFSSYDEYFNYHMKAYGWIYNTNDLSYYEKLSENDNGRFMFINGNETFEDFCYKFVESNWSKDIHFIPQSDMLCDDDGELIPDYIGKQENIENDLKEISKILGCDINLESISRKTNHKYYREVYSKNMKNIVEEFFAKDFELFDYHF